LIHGAADDAFRAWVHPLSLTTPDVVPLEQQGLMQQLTKMGFPVFAINFSHNHGCNYRQAEHIHNAIDIIQKKTGASKVHLIAHSKGNCAASIYLSDGPTVNPKYSHFLSKFESDVDVYVQIGAGNKGIDVIFRYYAGNLFSLTNNLSSPVCFHSALLYGLWSDCYKKDIYYENPGTPIGNYFPGQCQLLFNLVKDGMDFSFYSYTPIDFNATMIACYYGGTTAFVSCYGIEHAIQEGDFTIARLNEQGIDPSVKIVNIYGTKPVIQEIDLGLIKIPVGVQDYPSDGIVYTHSASYVQGLTKRGAKLIAQRGFEKNHFRISFDPEVVEWMANFFE
jgi:hypothetical protein